MAFRDLPRSEFELVQRRPSSHLPDVTPKTFLFPGERVLFETRASVLSLYWGRLTVLGLWAAFVTLAGALPDGRNVGFWVFIVLVGYLPLAVVALYGYRNTYALTNARVLACDGLISRSCSFAYLPEIQNLRVGTGATDTLRFEVLGYPMATGTGAYTAGRPVKTIVWAEVRDAQQVYAFVQDAFRFEATQQRPAASAPPTSSVPPPLSPPFAGAPGMP